MNDSEIKQLVSLYARGEMTSSQHETLANELHARPEARKLFRELVDLETGLATWANEAAELSVQSTCESNLAEPKQRHPLTARIIVGLAAAIVAFAAVAWVAFQSAKPDPIAGVGNKGLNASPDVALGLGTIRQSNCSWSSSSFDSGSGRFAKGEYKLASGVAQFRFDSGTWLTVDGPCELSVDSLSSAKLTKGNVVVRVSELSDGFLLTTPEAEIVDLGTEYGVAIDEETTEVHVFDGSVIWQPFGANEDQSATIVEGQASAFARADPQVAKRISFGRRKFVREMEADIQEQAKGQLIAFDGFENLAGKVRRGRSGFGWTGGWQPPGRRRNTGTILDAPDDPVFGWSRKGKRLLQLADGAVIQRELENAIFDGRSSVFLSLILHRTDEGNAKDAWFQLAIQSNATGRQARRTENGIGFGISSNSSAFVKNAGAIKDLAIRFPAESLFCVAKLSIDDQKIAQIRLRVYQAGEIVDEYEPENWTVSSVEKPLVFTPSKISLSTGTKGKWNVDHLRVGETWSSVVNFEMNQEDAAPEQN